MTWEWRRHDKAAVLACLKEGQYEAITTSAQGGLPKGVMLSHYNLVSNIRQFLSVSQVDQDDVFINHLPFYHIYGLNLLINAPLPPAQPR